MWRRRRRYVFRKRSMGGRILRLVVGILVVMGLIWLMPWATLSSVPLEDSKVEASEDQPDQEAATIEQPEQETAKDRFKDENAPKTTPLPKEERASSNPLPPSSHPVQPPSPTPAQASLPSPPLPSPKVEAKVEEISNNFRYSNNSRDFEPDYGDYYYGDYGSSYWEYWPDY